MAKQKSKAIAITQKEFFQIASDFNEQCQKLLKEKGVSFLGCISTELDTGEMGTANITVCKAGIFKHLAVEIAQEIQSKL